MKSRIGSKSRVAAALMVLALTLAACDGGNDEATSGESNDQPYHLGFENDFSGPIAYLGKPLQAGFMTYIDHINDEGGVNGRQIEISALDNGADAQRGTSNIRQLGQEGVLGIFGNLVSNISAAVAPLAESQQIPQVHIGLPDDFVVPPQPYLYSTQFVGATSSEVMIQFAKQLASDQGLDSPRIATIATDSASADDFVQYVGSRIEEEGWQHVTAEVVDITGTDVSPQAAAIAGADADFVIMNIIDAITPLTVKGIRQRGYEGPIINYNGGESENTFKELSDPNFYALRGYVYPLDPEAEGAEEMLQQARDTGNYSDDVVGSSFFTAGYIQGMLAVAALEKCGACTSGAEFNEALEAVGTLDAEGLAADLALGPDRHRLTGAGRMYVWDDAKQSTVSVTDWIAVDVGVTEAAGS